MENKDVYFNFLEELRKSGETNMFGATPYLEANFEELTHAEAVAILKEWMKNYEELSKRLGWSDSESSAEEDETFESDYSKLFDSEISKDVVDSFLKQLAEENLMDELNNADHIWYIEGLPFIVSYEDGSVKLFNKADRISVYEDIDEWCNDFGFDVHEVMEKISEKTNGDLELDTEEDSFEDDSEDVIEYGSDEIIDDISDEE